MARLAIIYSTKYGQTLRIAERIAGRLRGGGHTIELYDAGRPPSREALAKLDGVVLGSWVRGGVHMGELRRFATDNADLLARMPSAFYSVSLLQNSSRAESRARATGYIARFVEEIGWQPRLTAPFAGAMTYTRFGWLTKRLMRAIWRREGVDTDITRDHEYTRWDEVDRFADAFAALLPAREAALEPDPAAWMLSAVRPPGAAQRPHRS